MRLISANIQNYRIHRELTVNFDRGLTLIGGPNESGKSTLVEAIHRALFLNAKGNTSDHRATKSIHGGHPKVELTLETGGKTYTLTKIFSGTNGTITLAPQGEAVLIGDDAQQKLNSILQRELNSGNGINEWSHLWVWQGQAAANPVAFANAQQQDLLVRLQQEGAASVLQSDLDGRVGDRFSTWRKENLNLNGSARAGTDLARAAQELQMITEQLSVANRRAQELDLAFTTLEISKSDADQVKGALQNLKKREEELNQKKEKLNQLLAKKKEQEDDKKVTEGDYKKLGLVNNQISGLRVELEGVIKAQRELENEKHQVEFRRNQVAQSTHESEKQLREIREKLEVTRTRKDLLAAYQLLMDYQQQQKKIVERKRAIEDLQVQKAGMQRKMASLPDLGHPQMIELETLSSEFEKANALLNGMEARLEVIAAGLLIQCGEQILSEGQGISLTDVTELHIGKQVHLRINPGGGRTLADARYSASEAQHSLHQRLQGLQLTDLRNAHEVFASREKIKGHLQQIDAGLNASQPGTVDSELSAMEGKIHGKTVELELLKQDMPDWVLPSQEGQVEALSKQLDQELGGLRQEESRTTTLIHQRLAESKTADRLLQEKAAQLSYANSTKAGVLAQLDLLMKEYGTEQERSRLMEQTQLKLKIVAETLQALEAEIQTLAPDYLASELKQIKQSILNQEKREQDITFNRRLAFDAIQRAGGTENPWNDIAEVQACENRTRQHYDALKRKTEAICLLDSLFQEEKAALANEFTQPLAEKVSGYLCCLYGPMAKAQVVWENNNFSGLTLTRDGATVSFGFTDLSIGAREQLAIAFRLAVAEVLADGFGGCLPVICDDAFTNSDHNRVQKLHKMLYYAKERGLQVIVLSCKPTEYTTLGAGLEQYLGGVN